MHFTSFIPAAALFLISYTSGVSAAEEHPHQIVARSSKLAMRQLSGDFGSCNSQCQPVMTKLNECGTSSISCLCGTGMSAPFHDCAECGFNLTSDASIKSQLVSAYNQYVEACKQAGSPVSGDTTLGDGPSGSTSTSSKNDAASLSSGFGVTVGAAMAASALFL